MITMSKKWHKDYTNISHKKIFVNRKETKDQLFVKKRFAFLKETINCILFEIFQFQLGDPFYV